MKNKTKLVSILLLIFLWPACIMAATLNIKSHVIEFNKTVAPLLNFHAQPTMTLKRTNQLFQRSQFQQAHQALLPWAEQGNPIAQLEIGFLYEFGQGVKQNYQHAAQWYYLAVRPYAYNKKPLQRAFKAYYGLGGEKINYYKAAVWFRMAAELSVDQY